MAQTKTKAEAVNHVAHTIGPRDYENFDCEAIATELRSILGGSWDGIGYCTSPLFWTIAAKHENID